MLRGVRKLSLNLGDGKCKWTPPQYDVPTDIDFYKLLVAGYPSGDKRLTYVQLEALSGLPARDEWNFKVCSSNMDHSSLLFTSYMHD